MKLLPFEYITYHTRLSPKEVMRRIRDNVGSKPSFSLGNIFGNTHDKPYQGTIHEHSFKISRVIGYKNSFLPRISGLVKEVPELDRTVIQVSMILSNFMIFFMAIWGLGIGLVLMMIFIVSPHKSLLDPVIWTPASFLFLMYIISLLAFKLESIPSKKFLAELFEAEMV